MASKSTTNPVLLRRNMHIGFADAEADTEFLDRCFVDTGHLTELRTTDGPKCIVIGRTGSGKTALLKRVVDTEENTSQISPEMLSLHYISNSNVIQFFDSIGVRLDAFYILLWRHILTVELLKLKYKMYNEDTKRAFLVSLKNIFRTNQAKEKAIQYLEEWGDHFWEETEHRIKEFTTKLERELSLTSTINLSPMQLGAEGAKRMTEDQKTEIITRARAVVNKVQLKDLHAVISLLEEDIFTDPQKRYFLIVDRLDEEWVEDTIRYKLIKSLIEAVRAFRKIRTVKILVAMRTDLLHRVITETKDAGFQEEKYESLYLRIHWKPRDIRNVLDTRVRYMFQKQYTREPVSLDEIMPTNQIDQRTAVEYIIDRTFLRPREAILFVNECIDRSEGATRVKANVIKSSEVAYSQQRLRSLYDEWGVDFPALKCYVDVLKRRPGSFAVCEITDEDLERVGFALLNDERNSGDPLYKVGERCFLGDDGSLEQFRNLLVRTLYQVGALGVKLEAYESVRWSYMDEPLLSEDYVTSETLVSIHKTFWAALWVLRQAKGMPRSR